MNTRHAAVQQSAALYISAADGYAASVPKPIAIASSAFFAAAAGLLAVVALTPPLRAAAEHDSHDAVMTTTLAHQLREPIPTPQRPVPTARLRLRNVVHRDILDVVPFDGQGHPRAAAFRRINHFFRSARGSEVDIDPRLVELLMTISRHYGGRTLTLISGHRDPGGSTSKKSYHVRGQAADIAVPGVRARDLY